MSVHTLFFKSLEKHTVTLSHSIGDDFWGFIVGLIKNDPCYSR